VVLSRCHYCWTYLTVLYRTHNLTALERCAGEVVTDILEIVESYDPDDAQMQLVMRGTYF
jgi:hypothetical protein